MTFDINLGNDVYLTYGTPVLKHMVADAAALNTELKRIVLAREQAHPEFRLTGRNKSAQGGWQSAADLLSWPAPEIATLQGEIETAITKIMQLVVANDPDRRIEPELSLVAWANINRDGDYNILHGHAGNHWSGTYYVSAGDPDPDINLNGYFEFYDPRNATTMGPVPGFNFGYTMPVEPIEGMMIVFPSWHLHSVHPFRGRGDRISIAFNAVVTKLDKNAAD